MAVALSLSDSAANKRSKLTRGLSDDAKSAPGLRGDFEIAKVQVGGVQFLSVGTCEVSKEEQLKMDSEFRRRPHSK